MDSLINIMQTGDAIRDLGIIFDSELSMQRHVNKVTSDCVTASITSVASNKFDDSLGRT